MTADPKLFPLSGKVQHYQWGGFVYIPDLLGVNNTAHRPFAEYWLGAHINGPAVIAGGKQLPDFLKEHPAFLGTRTQNAFGRLPYLLKILDVKDMLSIQVHPDKKSAAGAFARENEAGIARDDPRRNYNDDNHKPELMVALGEFWLLHGFLVPDKLIASLRSVPEFEELLPVFGSGNYRALYEKVMTMDQQVVNRVLRPVLDRIVPAYQSGNLEKSDPAFWAARAALTFSRQDNHIDRGIFSIYLFNIVRLRKGEAVFQDAGILHAYLEGQNVEIMANSDNVLRGGLTPKHVDVPELLKHVVFKAVVPDILRGDAAGAHETVFHTIAPDFELSRILLPAGSAETFTVSGTDIFLVIDGTVEAAEQGHVVTAGKGAAFIGGNGAVIACRALSACEIYRASVPVPAGM